MERKTDEIGYHITKLCNHFTDSYILVHKHDSSVEEEEGERGEAV